MYTTVPGSIPGGVTWDFFFRGSFRQNHVPWGQLSLWKWVPGISLGVKAAGAFGWRTTTLVVPKVEKIQGLNLPGTPRATSACRGTPLLYFIHIFTSYRGSLYVRSKTVPLQARCGPEGSRRLRLPDFMTFGTWRWWGCQPCALAAFTSRNVPGTHFH